MMQRGWISLRQFLKRLFKKTATSGTFCQPLQYLGQVGTLGYQALETGPAQQSLTV